MKQYIFVKDLSSTMRSTYLVATLAVLLLWLTAPTSSQITFGSDPQPVVQRVNIHDVSNLTGEDRENNSNLIDSITPGGSDNTLNVSKSKDVQGFRLDFLIKNEGDQDFSISSNDELFHNGLDAVNWSLDTEEGAWYRIENGSKRRGASLVNGKLEWDTSNGGILPSGGRMNASYLFNTSQNISENYNQTFRAENTGASSGSEYQHNTSIEIRDPGELNVTLNEPPNNTRLQVNKTFEINSTVECLNGECGNVNLSARYNQSGSRLDIPDSPSEPFYTIGSNPKTCQSMEAGDSCTFNFDVNATGPVGNEYSIDTKARSALPGVENNQSEKSLVNIDFFLIVRDFRNTTSFGSVDLNTSFNPAIGNNESSGHQITVDNYSQPVDSFYLQVDNLTSNFNPGYRIGPSNFSFNLENNPSTSERATGGADLVTKNIQPGTTIDLYYWLDVPLGIVQDYYNGTVTMVAASEL